MSILPFRLAPLRAGITVLALALAGFWATPQALAQANARPPERMTYQGFLADGNGNPLGNTNTGPKNYDIIFRIWLEQTGGASSLWAEQQTVTVDKGYFSVLLGEGTTLSSPVEPHNNLSTLFTNATASDRFVEMTVKGIGAGGSAVTIQPRLRLLTSPYSYLATKAVSAISVDGGAVTTGTLPDARLSANVALRLGGNTFTGNQDITGGTLRLDNNQYIYGKNSGGAYEQFLMPRYTDNVTYMNFGSAGFNIRNNTSTSRMFVTDAGNVGIGTTTPGYKLDVADRIRISDGASGTAGLWLRTSSSDRAFLGMLNSDYFGVFGGTVGWNLMMNVNNGYVGIGTSTPAAKLDVSGELRASGGITTGSGTSLMLGHAPLIVEEKTPNEQATWNAHIIDLSPWADRPGGFKIRIYAQHEAAAADYEVRNYEATVTFEQAGYANNAQLNSGIYRLSFSWTGNQGRQNMKLGTVNSSGGGLYEIFPDGWVKLSNYIPNSVNGGSSSYSYYGPFVKYLMVTFHPSVSGRVVISDY